jgi:hypothetical protein
MPVVQDVQFAAPRSELSRRWEVRQAVLDWLYRERQCGRSRSRGSALPDLCRVRR